MSDDIDEWANDMRLAIERAQFEGKEQITFTVPVKALSIVVEVVHGHFRDVSRTCVLCGAIRRMTHYSTWLAAHTSQNPNWRRDAKLPPRRK